MVTTAVSLPRTLLLSGLLCIAGAAVFASNLTAFRRRVAPIYQRLGLIPSATGAPASEPPFARSTANVGETAS